MTQRGRPRVLADEQKRRTLLAMISVGAGLETAAKHAGCSTWTVRREVQRDEQFAQQLREAETAAELAPLQTMRKAASTQWRAAAWLLERMNPERFVRRQPQALAPTDVRSLLDSVANLMADECDDPEQQQRMIRRLAELQEEHFGEAQAQRQGTPTPMSEIERFLTGFDRTSNSSQFLLEPR